LYWSHTSYTGVGPIFELTDGSPSWLTITSGQWLAMGRRLYLFFAWVLVINSMAYLVYSIANRHFVRGLALAGDAASAARLSNVPGRASMPIEI
jgi:thiosulfate reductase cytochrome b subunit